MKFIQHWSSSKANFYEVIGSRGQKLLLECGLRWQQLQHALNFNFRDVVGCLLTCEHLDHAKAIRQVMTAGIDVYASKGTLKALGEDVYKHRKSHAVYERAIQQIGEFLVFPFNTVHDAAEPFGYVIQEHGEWLFFAPESGYVKQRFNIRFDIIAIEVNYDKEILGARVDSGDINEEVAKRVAQNHTKKQTAIDYLEKYCDLRKCREIHLLHCSGVNLDKKKTKQQFEKKFLRETIIKGVE